MYRVLAMILGILCPLVMIIAYPEISSLSNFWNTPLVPLFIIMNIVTAYFFYLLPNWKVSGVLLFLLTAFPVNYFGQFHNILAVIFFISCMYAIAQSSRYSWLVFPFIAAVIISAKSLFWGEVASIYIICTYHLLTLRKSVKITKQRKNS